MLADPKYCEMVHNIGLASLHANEKQIWHLTKIYWYVAYLPSADLPLVFWFPSA